MQLSLADDLIFAILAGLIIHTYALGKSVAAREVQTSFKVATFWIFLSSLWFIGPVTYFVFRKKRPLLARRCLQQLVVFTIASVAMGVISHSAYLRSISGAILPPQSSPL